MSSAQATAQFPAAKVAREVLDTATSGSLATLTAEGAPFASLVLVAADGAGDVVFLVSRLAVHTQNLIRDPRASFLAVAPGGEAGDPLAGARVTVLGQADREVSETAKALFLTRHPEAQGYASFADFGFWRLKIESAHLVAGFGRIVDLDRGELLQSGGR